MEIHDPTDAAAFLTADCSAISQFGGSIDDHTGPLNH